MRHGEGKVDNGIIIEEIRRRPLAATMSGATAAWNDAASFCFLP